MSYQKHVFENQVADQAAAGGAAAAGAAAAAAAAAAAPPQMTAADARKFVTDFVHDPKVIEGMKDEDVVAYHTRINGTLDKVRPKANGAWPEKWRDEFSGGDEKLAARFGRYNSPKDVAAALVAAQNKIAEGGVKAPLQKDATPDQLTAWRKENGIPEKPEEYFGQLKLKDGMVIGDDDKPIIEAFLKVAHSQNMAPGVASAAVDWYYDELDRQTELRAAGDKKAALDAEDALRKEWGTNYRQVKNVMDSFLDSMPEGIREGFKRGRLADGTPLLASAPVMSWLAQQASSLNPAGIIVTADGATMASSIDDEIKTIEGWMKAAPGSAEYKKYWSDDKVSGPKGRYYQLLQAREKAQAQKAG